MARPMTPTQLLEAFKEWGVYIQSQPGWDTHKRPGEFAPEGIMIHHTGDDAPDRLDFGVLWHGRSDLPGPLCHWGMGDDGKAWLVSAGRANHAGIGSGRVLTAIDGGHYRHDPPEPGPDDTDGNTHFYGQEAMYSGLRTMTDRQYNATIRACAAICDYHKWSGKRIIGHREWTRRKIDPGKVSMSNIRADVNHALVIGSAHAKRYNFRDPAK